MIGRSTPCSTIEPVIISGGIGPYSGFNTCTDITFCGRSLAKQAGLSHIYRYNESSRRTLSNKSESIHESYESRTASRKMRDTLTLQECENTQREHT